MKDCWLMLILKRQTMFQQRDRSTSLQVLSQVAVGWRSDHTGYPLITVKSETFNIQVPATERGVS